MPFSDSNTGRQALTGVMITDALPGGMTYVTDTSGLTRAGVSPLVWTVGDLAAGARRSFSLVARVPATATGTLTNTASIGSLEADAKPADNTAHGSINCCRVPPSKDRSRRSKLNSRRCWPTKSKTVHMALP